MDPGEPCRGSKDAAIVSRFRAGLDVEPLTDVALKYGGSAGRTSS